MLRLLALSALLIASAAHAGGETPLQFWASQAAPEALHGRGGEAALVWRASWYGGGERLNSRTATGERFRPAGFTAAHRTLPFGTWLEVTSLATGRAVRVRVNDRGPAKWTGRALDLSRAAAAAIGMLAAGEARVTVKIMTLDSEVTRSQTRLK